MSSKTISIASTNRGFAAVWESGGGMTSGGSATIVTKSDGSAPRAVYIPRGGHLACGDHALIPVHEGYYLVRVSVRRGSRDSGRIERIVSTSVKDIDGEKFSSTAEVEEINTFSNGQWIRGLDEKFSAAVEAAFRKAGTYHCRSAFFIDSSVPKPLSDSESLRRADEARRQDQARAALRQAKADREAQVKAEAEATSRAAKAAGLGARLEAVNLRLQVLGRDPVELSDAYFKWGWQNQLYTEQGVASVERQVAETEAKLAEKERKQLLREEFEPKFEVFRPRLEALGLKYGFYDDGSVALSKGGHIVWNHSVSEEGVLSFATAVAEEERKAGDIRRQAAAALEYARQVSEAEADPENILRDFGGVLHVSQHTGQAAFYVVRPDGTLRDSTSESWSKSHQRGAHSQHWEIVFPDELALTWSKSTNASPHDFEVRKLPKGGTCTEAQLETVAALEDQIEQAWEGRTGFASGLPSPSVGEGWGLRSRISPEPMVVPPVAEGGERASASQLDALCRHFGR